MKKLTICCAVLMLAVGCGDDVVDPVDAGGDDVDSGGDTDSGTDDEDSGTDPDSGTDTDSGTDAGTPDEPECETYCTTIMAACTEGNAQYSSRDNCIAVCAHFDEVGTAADVEGNTLGCRLYHAGVAATSDPAMHCRHAGPGGDGACGSNCEGFCDIAEDACPASTYMPGGCMTQCAMFLPGDEPYDTMDTMSNTFACRLYHLTQAVETPEPHCDHTNVISTAGTCGGV